MAKHGRITKTNRLGDDVSDLYCQCTDAECGHFVVCPYLNPFGQDHEPVGTGLDELADTRGAAVGVARIEWIVTSWNSVPKTYDILH